jgi:flagellar biosynthesis protein FlhF
MNVKRFVARSSREALNRVRMAFGADAVVLSNRPCEHGVEVLAMAPGAIAQIEQVAETVAPTPTAQQTAQPRPDAPIEQDVQSLAMSTLSFQDHVRERLLRRRRAAMGGDAPETVLPTYEQRAPATLQAPARDSTSPATLPTTAARTPSQRMASPQAPSQPMATPAATLPPPAPAMPAMREPRTAVQPAPITVPSAALRLPEAVPSLADPAASQREQLAVMDELRAVKGLIEDRFSALAFMEQLHRNPRQSSLSQRLLEAGFSPALVRKLVEHLPHEATDEIAWAQGVLARNLQSDEASLPIEDLGGVYALIGATGVGKTTSTAKIAASFGTWRRASRRCPTT